VVIFAIAQLSCITGINYRVCRPIPDLNAAEEELLALLSREMAGDKKFNAGKVRLTRYCKH